MTERSLRVMPRKAERFECYGNKNFLRPNDICTNRMYEFLNPLAYLSYSQKKIWSRTYMDMTLEQVIFGP